MLSDYCKIILLYQFFRQLKDMPSLPFPKCNPLILIKLIIKKFSCEVVKLHILSIDINDILNYIYSLYDSFHCFKAGMSF